MTTATDLPTITTKATDTHVTVWLDGIAAAVPDHVLGDTYTRAVFQFDHYGRLRGTDAWFKYRGDDCEYVSNCACPKLLALAREYADMASRAARAEEVVQ